MKIGLCGNMRLDSIAQALDRRAPDCEIIVGRADAFESELSRPAGEFLKIDLCIVAYDWSESPDLEAAWAPGENPEKILSLFRQRCADLETFIREFRRVRPAPVLLFAPVSSPLGPAGFIDRLLEFSQFNLSAQRQKTFNRLCCSMTDIYPVDIDEIAAAVGKNSAFDRHEGTLNGQSFSPTMLDAVAERIVSIVIQLQRYPLKCLVLDLDGTLWGGVAGEDGFDNLQLGDSGTGRAYKNFQALICKYYRQGAILALCSKNNTCDALEVLERHRHCLVRPSMVSCFRINWDDKPKNMLGIAAELNIGLDAMIFVDDSPAERALMKDSLPEVLVLDLPEDPAFFADTLLQCSRLWPLQLTSEDMGKGDHYAKEKLRKTAERQTGNIEKFLLNSAIHAEIGKADCASIPRVAQLFNKTNQFTLSAQRYTQSELEKLISAPSENRLYCMSLRDRYGDYGTIGAALVRNGVIDSFAISCRAFGKQAETAFLIFILEDLKKARIRVVRGIYRPTGRNGMARDFLSNCGFAPMRKNGDQSEWQFDLNGPILPVPPWITLSEVI
jgi:FkbH-like protein